jgi:predicted metalloenzyme YecM
MAAYSRWEVSCRVRVGRRLQVGVSQMSTSLVELHTTCNIDHTTYSIQHTACNCHSIQHTAAYNIQHATPQHTAYKTQHTAYTYIVLTFLTF